MINGINCYFQTHIHIGNDRYISVRTFNDKTRVHIRQYVKYGERSYPTPVGVYLNVTQFRNFIFFLEEIKGDVKNFRDNKLSSFKYLLGEGIHVTASEGFSLVHFRLYFQNEEMPVALPTKTGLALRFEEWDNLINVIDEVKKNVNID